MGLVVRFLHALDEMQHLGEVLFLNKICEIFVSYKKILAFRVTIRKEFQTQPRLKASQAKNRVVEEQKCLLRVS